LNDAANLFANHLVFSLRFQIDCFVGSTLLLAKKKYNFSLPDSCQVNDSISEPRCNLSGAQD
jgi:hypothetical protein